jgi:citrate synthase
MVPENKNTEAEERDQEEIAEKTKNIGLRGIVVADSTICNVDGKAGKLIYRGYDVMTLAQEGSYEEVVHLLLKNSLPSGEELAVLKRELTEARHLPGRVIDTLRTFPIKSTPMDVLQATVPVLGMYDSSLANSNQKDTVYRQAIRLTAQMPLLVTAWDRIRNGKPVVEPLPELGQAANFLYTLRGEVPDPESARDMDVAFILHAEHAFNASAFTARQVASTRAHLYAAIASAIGSLSGELHGGANAQVLNMLEDIGSVDNVRDYVTYMLDHGGRIMGMGHPVYKVFDPRAGVLREMSRRQSQKGGDMTLYLISEEVAKVTAEEFQRRKGIVIYPNVDFFSATAYHAMGLPTDLFTPIFAVARVVGWSAHYIEERFAEAQPKPALYRPSAEYTGRYCGAEACEWVPLEKRQAQSQPLP